MPPGILSGVYDNSNIIRGHIMQTAILKPGNMGAGDIFMYAQRPILIDSHFLDFDKSTKLDIVIRKGLANNRILLTLTTASLNTGDDGTGKLAVNFKADSTPGDTVAMSIPLRQYTPADFYAQSKTFTQDYTTINLSSADFQDLMIVSVKIDIFTPIQFALAGK